MIEDTSPADRLLSTSETQTASQGIPAPGSRERRLRVDEVHGLVLKEASNFRRLGKLCKAPEAALLTRSLVHSGLDLLDGYGCLWEPPDDDGDAEGWRVAQTSFSRRLRLLTWLVDQRLRIGSKLRGMSVHASVLEWSEQLSASFRRPRADWPQLKRQLRKELAGIPIQDLERWLEAARTRAYELEDPIDYPTIPSLPAGLRRKRALCNGSDSLNPNALGFLACCPMVNNERVPVNVICYRMTTKATRGGGPGQGSLAKARSLHVNCRRRLIPYLLSARWIFALEREKLVQTIPPGPVFESVLHERDTCYREGLAIMKIPQESNGRSRSSRPSS